MPSGDKMTKEQEKRVDHVELAKACIDRIGGFYDGDGGRDDRDVRALVASASAQIAIAEELRRLNETLKEAPHLLNQIAVGVNR